MVISCEIYETRWSLVSWILYEVITHVWSSIYHFVNFLKVCVLFTCIMFLWGPQRRLASQIESRSLNKFHVLTNLLLSDHIMLKLRGEAVKLHSIFNKIELWYYLCRIKQKAPSSMRKICGFASSCARVTSQPGFYSTLIRGLIEQSYILLYPMILAADIEAPDQAVWSWPSLSACTEGTVSFDAAYFIYYFFGTSKLAHYNLK